MSIKKVIIDPNILFYTKVSGGIFLEKNRRGNFSVFMGNISCKRVEWMKKIYIKLIIYCVYKKAINKIVVAFD